MPVSGLTFRVQTRSHVNRAGSCDDADDEADEAEDDRDWKGMVRGKTFVGRFVGGWL